MRTGTSTSCDLFSAVMRMMVSGRHLSFLRCRRFCRGCTSGGSEMALRLGLCEQLRTVLVFRQSWVNERHNTASGVRPWRTGPCDAAGFARADAREFRTEIENYCGVVHPNDHDDERACRAIRGADGGLSQIPAQQRLACGEEKSRRDGTLRYASPSQFYIRHISKDQREENGTPRGNGDKGEQFVARSEEPVRLATSGRRNSCRGRQVPR